MLSSSELIELPLSEQLYFYRQEMKAALSNLEGNGRLMLSHIFALTLLHIANALDITVQAQSKQQPYILSKYLPKIEELIKLNLFTEHITLDFLAERLFLSKKQVSRIIKRGYNCSLPELVTNAKLTIAAAQLRRTKKHISEIIRELNFQTENYFFTLFKKKYGCTPLAYRKQS
jgi:AraC-like DNA-binding protein